MTITLRRTPDDAEHRFAIGQSVRMVGGFAGLNASANDVYQVIGKLPPSNGDPQYRIRSDKEAFDRVSTEARLEAADTADSALKEKTFRV